MAEKVEYLIKKRTTTTRYCKACGGSGVTPRGGKCIECNNGAATMWHTTEVDLITALQELGLLKKNR